MNNEGQTTEKTMKQRTHNMTVRLPAELVAPLRALAKAELRSVSSCIVAILRRRLATVRAEKSDADKD